MLRFIVVDDDGMIYDRVVHCPAEAARISEAIVHEFRISPSESDEMRKKPQGNSIILRAKAYIRDNLHRSFTLADVAEHVHFSPTYFSEYFKEKTGETFMHYVNRMRIEKARALLHDPSARVYDISASVGYKTSRSFAKMFKAGMGVTPTEYRNRDIAEE